MSARWEKRLRRMETRVEYLEKLARVNEHRLSDLERLAASPTYIVGQPDREAMQPKPRRGLLQRIKDLFA